MRAPPGQVADEERPRPGRRRGRGPPSRPRRSPRRRARRTTGTVAGGGDRPRAASPGRGSVEYTPKTCLVMCIPTPLTRPSAPGVGAQPLDHRRDRVREVSARRAAVVRQAAGDRQAARIGRRDPERVGGEVQRAREARVEIEVRDVVDADAGAGRAPRALAAAIAGERAEVGMLGDEHRIVRARTSPGGRRADRPGRRARRRARGSRRPAPRPCRRPSPRPCTSCTGSRPCGCRARASTISAASRARPGTTRAGSRPRPSVIGASIRPMPAR